MTVFAFLALANFASAQDRQKERLQVSSTTFEDGATMPSSAIYNLQFNGVNVCSLDGSPGGNESPELSWTNAPRHTASFVVIAFDVTAGFIHWGMYNIPPTTTELPENAGVTGSSYGQQVINDFGSAGNNAFISYDGPCPPPHYPPNGPPLRFHGLRPRQGAQIACLGKFPPHRRRAVSRIGQGWRAWAYLGKRKHHRALLDHPRVGRPLRLPPFWSPFVR